MIPYGRQSINQSDIDSVIAVLKSDFLTQGPAVPKFEHALAEYCGTKHGVAVNSATSALHIACLALGVGPGDVVWTSPLTFVASSNCALYCGAEVSFVDIDPVTYNMCPRALEEKLVKAEAEGRLPKVVIPVHLCGQCCDMAAIGALAQRFGIKVIEDASHAIGGRYGDKPVGSCEHSDITVFSFHPVKIITTAEGGMAMTNDAHLARHLSLLRSHGVTRDPLLMTEESHGSWFYQQTTLGFNYRMTDLQAALGISQMERLDQFVARRHQIADQYDARLSDLPISIPNRQPGIFSSLHLYVILLDDPARHRQVFEELRSAGIMVNVHYIPVHTQPYYQGLGHRPGDYPAAENYYSRAISLPMFPTMMQEQIDTVIQTIREILL